MSEVFVQEESGLNLERANLLLAGIGNGSGIYHAVSAALKRAAESAKSKAGQYASAEYNITQGGFKSHVKDKMISEGGGGGVASVKLIFAGSVIPLIEFNARFSKTGGVAVSVKRGGGGVLAHAFVANIGKIGVYERLTTRRFPVEQKYGPSTAHMMENETVESKMEQQVVTVFNERIEHEITRVLNGW